MTRVGSHRHRKKLQSLLYRRLSVVFLAGRNTHFSCIVYPKMWGSEVLNFGSVFHRKFLCEFRILSITNSKVESPLEKLTVPQLVTKFPAFYANTSTFPLLSQINPLHTSISICLNEFQHYPPIYHWAFQVVSLHQDFPPKPCMNLSSPPYVLHDPLISFFLI